MQQHKMWRGAMILTISALIMKVLSVMYRIPYQNIAGDVGYYVYQQVYPFFGIGITLATYGFPVIISKLVADKLQHHKHQEVFDILSVSFYFLNIVGMSVFLVLYLGANAIAVAMGDVQLGSLIRVISFYFLLMPTISVLRGYFQGGGNMIPTAVSQLGEQIIRVASILLLSYFLLQHGFGLYEIGEGAISGSIFGVVVGTGLLLFFFMKSPKIGMNRSWSHIPNKRYMMKTILYQGIIICICNLSLVLIQFIDSLTIYSLLVENGMEVETAKAAKGVYDRGWPLIQVGTVVATSIALALVPQLAKGTKHENHKNMYIALKYCFTFGIGATIGLIFIAEPTNIMLYKTNAGTGTLAILAGAIFFSSLSIASAAILQGINQMIPPALHVLIGMGLKLALNVILVPLWGVNGSAVATILALVAVVVLNDYYLNKVSGMSIIHITEIGRILVAATAMALTLFLYMTITETAMFGLENRRVWEAMRALFGVVLGGIGYIGLLFRLHVINEKEVGHFIKQEKIRNMLWKK